MGRTRGRPGPRTGCPRAGRPRQILAGCRSLPDKSIAARPVKLRFRSAARTADSWVVALRVRGMPSRRDRGDCTTQSERYSRCTSGTDARTTGDRVRPRARVHSGPRSPFEYDCEEFPLPENREVRAIAVRAGRIWILTPDTLMEHDGERVFRDVALWYGWDMRGGIGHRASGIGHRAFVALLSALLGLGSSACAPAWDSW